MTDLVRQEIAAAAKRIVVKVGTRVLTGDDGQLNLERIHHLALQLHQIGVAGKDVILVSSGAVGAGMGKLGLTSRPSDLSRLQAIAAVGQTALMKEYEQVFSDHDRTAAQVLLTAKDLDDRAGYLNVRNTLLSLLDIGIIPIVNENDTVSVDELKTTFGDNDRLAALVSNLVGADLLIILSNVDGLFDGPPEEKSTMRIPVVKDIATARGQFVHDQHDQLSRGGMTSKLDAATVVTNAGENMIIANGKVDNVLIDILAGNNVGTLFMAKGETMSSWKRWLRFSAQPRGSIALDQGACEAVCKQGGSILSIGITAADGDFTKGDAVLIVDTDGNEIARGLTNYDATEVQQIMGLSSDRILETLGYRPYEEVVHRDNIAM